jgi:hypothetical protein
MWLYGTRSGWAEGSGRVAELGGAITGDATKVVGLSRLGPFGLPPIPRTPLPSPTGRSSGCAA